LTTSGFWRPKIFAGFFLAAALAAGSPAAAEDVVVLLSKENRIYQLIAQGITAKLQVPVAVFSLAPNGNSPGVSLEQIEKAAPKVLIAVGDDAANFATTEWTDCPVVLSGVIQSGRLTGSAGKFPGVSLNVPVGYQLKTLREYFPAVRIVGTLYDPAFNTAAAKDMEITAPALGLTVWAQPISQPREFTRIIDSMAGKVDAFLVLFDPVVLRPETFDYLVKFSLTHRVPLIVPAFALLKSGGMLSLEADYEEIGRQTADVAKLVLAHKKTPAGIAAPAKWSIGFNRKVARALEITVDPRTLLNTDKFHE
jgi:ABC-type uncharacterized transport system substrate-binding protein